MEGDEVLMPKIPVGLQLYTLREPMKEDFVGTLAKVAELGYTAVEFAGYGGLSAKEMKKVLGDLGLQAISSHVGLQQLRNGLQQEIEYCLEIGAKYLVCPWASPEKLQDEEEFAALMAEFKKFGEACRDNGLVFCYHNHAFEFAQVNGRYVLDRIYESVDASLLKAELDLYWVRKGGLDPRKYLLSYKGRCPLVHVKDMADDEKGSFTEVGRGVIDYRSIFEIAGEAGVQCYIVEQDQCLNHPPLESVRISIEYLKSIGIA
jgi:sugar phosphate isomerase/epimerase